MLRPLAADARQEPWSAQCAPAAGAASARRWAVFAALALVAVLLVPSQVVEAQEAQEPSTSVDLGGSVLNDDGDPLSGIAVTVFKDYSWGTAPPSDPNRPQLVGHGRWDRFEPDYVGETTTDGSGAWSMAVPDLDKWRTYVVLYRDPAGNLAFVADETAHSSDGEPVDLSEQVATMGPGAVVAGRLDLGSTPIPAGSGEFTVRFGERMLSFRLSPDPDTGAFSTRVPAGFEAEFHANIHDYATDTARVEAEALSEGAEVDVGTVRATKLASVSGRVVDDAGNGLAGVVVSGAASGAYSTSFGYWGSSEGTEARAAFATVISSYEPHPWLATPFEIDYETGSRTRTRSLVGYGRWSFHAVTDADGAYSVTGLWPDPSWIVAFAGLSGLVEFHDGSEPRPLLCDAFGRYRDSDGTERWCDDGQLDLSGIDPISLLDASDPGQGRAARIDVQLEEGVSVHTPSVAALQAAGIVSPRDRAQCSYDLNDFNHWCPETPITRIEMARWLVRAADGELEEYGENVDLSGEPLFDDVTWTWQRFWAERLADLEITGGCSVDPLRFCPDDPVKRADMASFLVRAFKLSAAEPFGFVDVSGWLVAPDIDALAAAEITVGCRREPLSFCPDDPVTRAEMATFLARALKQARDDRLSG